ncbi:hypothetical protein MGN70_008019 [Eutypa lata]|nr:hypothetical protein MGN70_008019 [Eutypa lata]
MRWFKIDVLLTASALISAGLNNLVSCTTPEEHAKALRDVLSPAAEVYLQNTTQFEAVAIRWSVLEEPTANIAVVPATEDDVVQTVKYAKKVDLPILAYNTAHAAITTLGRMDYGIEIYLGELSSVEIAQDNKTVTVGGGTPSKAVTDALWKEGKQTADGSLQTIDETSELWWAMKGAGQNFGIVTSLTSKIYEIEQYDWAIETLIFSGDKVEALYQAANEHFSNIPVDVINWSYWLNIPSADPEKPIILFYIIQEGTTVVDPIYTQPFHDIGPISIEPDSGTYLDLARWTNIALESGPCQKAGLANPRFPIYIEKYNVEAQKLAYDAFAAGVQGNSSFSASIFMFEAYPVQGVQAIDSDSTAFAFRSDSILAAPLITYTPAGEELDKQASELGNTLRGIVHEGSGREELHAYVNYAYGNESPQNWYGYEPWRQDRLAALKKQYDPEGRFSFFAPVIAG